MEKSVNFGLMQWILIQKPSRNKNVKKISSCTKNGLFLYPWQLRKRHHFWCGQNFFLSFLFCDGFTYSGFTGYLEIFTFSCLSTGKKVSSSLEGKGNSMNCFALMIFNIMTLVPNGHLFLKITLFSYYITFRHRFQDSFVAKAKTIHLYFYVLVIQNQFLHFCTCRYNVGLVQCTLNFALALLVCNSFLERRRSRKNY